jgi:hypothetical protein
VRHRHPRKISDQSRRVNLAWRVRREVLVGHGLGVARRAFTGVREAVVEL